MQEFVLKYDHNVVEHLGLKLYQNRPTRVIAEVVSNSWDADATYASVAMEMSGDMSARWISVTDNGHGMCRKDLSDSFLVIGRGRRADPSERSRGGRPLMGRKGIGKLAPFGIAKTIDIVTSAFRGGAQEVHWLRMDLGRMLEDDGAVGTYYPEILYAGDNLEELPLHENDHTGKVEEWANQIKGASDAGTAVIMRDLTLSRAIAESEVQGALGRQLMVSLGDEFSVTVNDHAVETVSTYPEFELRIPDAGFHEETIEGRTVRYWVGFVKTANWPQDRAGVGVYAHGKIAQERPFSFGIKGREIWTRYLYGVVEADWLDELDKDLISTDRTTVDWDSEETSALYEWGQKKVREWTDKYAEWRQKNELIDTKKRLQEKTKSGTIPKVTEAEEDQIVKLVSSISPKLGKDENARDRLLVATSEAWIQAPMRELIKDLWGQLGSGETPIPPDKFTTLIEQLSKFTVPESLNLAVVFAQRAFALSKLHDYVHHGREMDLQELLESFPWIIEPDLAVLTADSSLKKAVGEAEKHGQIPTGRRKNVGGVDEGNRPDFVFFSSPEERQIVVVELKSPQNDLTIDNRSQLIDYLTWLEAHYPDAERRGYLVGRNSANMKPMYEGVRIVPWTEIMQRSRARNLELLAAMLMQSGGVGSGDERSKLAMSFGDEETKDIIRRLAERDERLNGLLDQFGFD